MNDLLTDSQQDSIGLSKLDSLEREHLRLALIEKYLSGYEQGQKDAQNYISQLQNSSPRTSTQTAIESKVDGDFEGWEGETIVKLMNGQIWQQTEYYYHYHYSYMADVIVYRSGTGYKMKIEGIEKAVGVEQLK